MRTKIVGFGYKARQGKDTCVQTILENFPEIDIKRYAFADALKMEVRAVMDRSGSAELFFADWDNHRYAGTLPPRPPEVEFEPDALMADPLCPYGKHRGLLMWWGTEFRRAQDPDYWVHRVATQILLDKPTVALIADVRFPNEFCWVQSCRGITVRVSRPGYQIPSTHSSETALDGWKFDYEISAREGDLLGLERQAVETFDQILSTLSTLQ
jgi:hypothetical protein